MKWILFAFFHWNEMHAVSAEFNTKEACVNAGEQIHKALPGNLHAAEVAYLCIPKG